MRRHCMGGFATAIFTGFIAAGAIQTVQAADLTIGLREVQLTTDPHFMTSPASFQVNSQVFDPLLRRDNSMQPTPWLAESWQLVDETTWIFKLRKDVKWHDGTPFTAEDVVFTYKRAPNVPNSPTSFRTYLQPVKEAIAVDSHTLKIITDGPAPSLLEKLSYVLIVSKRNGDGAETADYHSSKAVIGTGPYKFVSWVQNEKTIIEKNKDYWGQLPEWDRITYRMIQNDSARIAALLAGDIDVAESVAAKDVENLAKNPNIRIFKKLTSRVAYITFDVEGAMKDGRLTGPNGEKPEKNFLEDKRVRQALVDAIDLDGMTQKLYRNEAEPTGQYLPPGVAGHDESIKPLRGSPEKAKAALEQLGVLGKFKLTLSVAAAFFPQSVEAAEGIAQLWTRAGVPTTVETTAYPTYLTNIRERKLAVYLGAYQNSTGSADNYFPTYFHTKTSTWGALNSIGYSNPKMDEMIEQATRTMDDAKRAQLWRNVTKYAVSEVIQNPLYFFYAVHASKKDLNIEMRGDRAILPINVTRPRS